MYIFSKNGFLLAMLFLLAACSAKKNGAPQAPLTLDVVDEANDGTSLYMLVRLRPELPFPKARSALRIVAMRDGAELHAYVKTLAELLPTDSAYLEKEVELPLRVDAPEATDYQIELLWGDEVPAPPPAVFTLTKVDLEEESCAAPPCGKRFSVQGTIENSSENELGRFELAAAFVRAAGPVDLSSRISENEERVRIEARIPKGAKKRVHIRFNRVVSDDEAKSLTPAVRIVEAAPA